jgi:succinate dehydrogenase / fumarate reductase flavoprotein subunit
MQGLADGYFIIPLTIGDYLARGGIDKIDRSHAGFRVVQTEASERTQKLVSINGRRTVTDFHRALGQLMWDECGMARSADSLQRALQRIPELRHAFWQDVRVPGRGADLNQSLEHAGRVADFLEFAELMCIDALHRDESCGGHFRVEHQTEEGEAKRNDERFAYAAVWEYKGATQRPELHKESLTFEHVPLSQRSYK